MGKRKDSINYVLSKLNKEAFNSMHFETGNFVKSNNEMKTEVRIDLLHKASNTIILIGAKSKTVEYLSTTLGDSFMIFNINKEEYKKSWNQLKENVKAAVNRKKHSAYIIPQKIQPAILGGRRLLEEHSTSSEKVKDPQLNNDITQAPYLDSEKDISNPYNINSDLIGKSPNWIMNSGMSIIGLAVVLFLIFSYFIKYPDKISSKGYVYNETPPIEHVFEVSGIIEEIFVEDNQFVKRGEDLLYIKNEVERSDYKVFSDFILNFEEQKTAKKISRVIFPKKPQLGEFGASFTALEFLVQELKQILRENETMTRINALQNEIIRTSELSDIITEDKRLLNEELALSDKNLLRYKNLNQDGAVSDLETENEIKSNLQLLKQINNVNKGLITNKIDEGQMQVEIQQLKESRNSNINSKLLSIKAQIRLLKNAMEVWEGKFYLKAENDGKVKFGSELYENFQVTKNQLAVTISPIEQKEKFVKLQIPSTGIGKMKRGDKVILKFDAYPYKEFGFVISKVDLISDYPVYKNETYLYDVEIPLADTIVTNSGFVIPLNPFTELTAEIITKDYSILKRIAHKASPIIK